jgi:hypothetical protein
MAFHVVKVYLMGVCGRHVWAEEVIDEGEGAHKRKEGRNGFDEHQKL